MTDAKDKKIAELEAELAEFKAERKAKHFVHAEFSCAEADRRREKAEALLRNASTQIKLMRDNNDSLKAEVERLRRLVLSKQQLLEKLAGPDCGPDPLFEREAPPGGSPSPPVSDAEARRIGQAAYARSVLEQKAAARKERDG